MCPSDLHSLLKSMNSCASALDMSSHENFEVLLLDDADRRDEMEEKECERRDERAAAPAGADPMARSVCSVTMMLTSFGVPAAQDVSL